MKRYPSISIITPTWNSNVALFDRVLRELKSQKYPKKLIEHIVLDAGSENDTVKVAKKYGCNVILRPDLQPQEQYREGLGISMAKGELILMLQSDNIITSKDWLERMVQPFLENQKIIGTYSAYNSYEKGMSITTRYTSLIGSGEPTTYYLHKTDKISLTQKKWDKGEIVNETENYYVVKYTKENLPITGDNGHMFLKKVIDKVNKKPEQYMHPDAFAYLLDKGYDTYGVVKNSIIHIITPDIVRYVTRRLHVKDKYFDKGRGKRKYLIFDWKSPRDRINVVKYVFLSFTLIYPLYESIRGYIKIKDNAWFLHPVLCFLMAGSYTYSEIKLQTRHFIKKLF